MDEDQWIIDSDDVLRQIASIVLDWHPQEWDINMHTRADSYRSPEEYSVGKYKQTKKTEGNK